MAIKLGFLTIRPEIENPIYWLHLGILVFVVLGLLQLFLGGEMLTLKNFLISIPLVALGDVIAHTILGID